MIAGEFNIPGNYLNVLMVLFPWATDSAGSLQGPFPIG